MRQVTLESHPTFHPHVCIRCGCGPKEDRPYFIDLGISLLDKFDPRYDGSIYYCALCADNLLTDLNTVISIYRDRHPVDSPAMQTYELLDSLGLDDELGTSDDADDRHSEQHDSGTDEDSSVSTESTPVSSSTVPDVSSDEGGIGDDESTGGGIKLSFG